MKMIIEEYGKAILYFMIACIVITGIYSAVNKSGNVVEEDTKSDVGTNVELANKQKPSLLILNTWIQQGTNFDPLQYVKAIDGSGKIITKDVQFFGQIDTSKKGKYDGKYVIRDEYGLLTKKLVTFVVD